MEYPKRPGLFPSLPQAVTTSRVKLRYILDGSVLGKRFDVARHQTPSEETTMQGSVRNLGHPRHQERVEIGVLQRRDRPFHCCRPLLIKHSSLSHGRECRALLCLQIQWSALSVGGGFDSHILPPKPISIKLPISCRPFLPSILLECHR